MIFLWQFLLFRLTSLVRLMSPLVSHHYLPHPDCFVILELTLPPLHLGLTDFHSLLHPSEMHCFDVHCSSFQCCSSPIHIRVKNKQKWISQDETVGPQTCKIKVHGYRLPLIADSKPTICFDLPLLVFHPIDVVHSKRPLQSDSSYV
jgi:hypothetical protein